MENLAKIVKFKHLVQLNATKLLAWCRPYMQSFVQLYYKNDDDKTCLAMFTVKFY